MKRRQGTRVLLWAAWTAFLAFWALRLKGQAIVFSDTVLYVFPEKWVNVEAWSRGVVPLWNPFIACGMPHLANWQAASLYPPFWLWNLTGLWDWFYYLALLHAAWAVLGFSLWLKRRGVDPVPAFFAAVCYGGSSQMVQFWGFPTHLATLSWVPWVFLTADSFLDRPSFPRWVRWVLCASMLITAGYLHFTAYTFLFLALWVAWRRPAARSWAGLALAGAAALWVTAAHWLPAVDFMKHSYRPPVLAGIYCLKPLEYLPIFSPRVLGLPNSEQYRGTIPNFIFLPAYIGWAGLAVFAAALAALPRLKERFWVLSALGVLVWGMGVHFAPWRLLFGKMSGMLEPSKACFLWSFCACTAAAMAFTQAWPRLRKDKAWRWAAAALGLVLALDIGSVPSRILQWMPDPLRDPQVVRSQEQISRMTGNGRMASLREKGLTFWSSHRGLEGHQWENAFQGFPNVNAVFGVRAVGGHLSTVVDGYQNMLMYLQKGFPYEGRVLDAAGVRAIVMPAMIKPIKYQPELAYERLLYHTNAGALPNAWRASWVKECESRPEAFFALTKPDVFLEETVFTEDRRDGRAVMLKPAGRSLGRDPRPSPDGWARLKRFLKGEEPSRAFTDLNPSPCQALFEADFKQKGWMVYSETFLPGWHAWVDGTPAPIFRADGLFMAVPVKEKGMHRIVFRYEPTAFRLGLYLTLLSCAGLALYVFNVLTGIRRKSFSKMAGTI